jgi:hypothetical protein
VISSKEGDMLGVFDFEAKQIFESFNRRVASIHEISNENVVGVWDLSSSSEQFEEIIELTVNISANSDWSRNWLYVGFFDQDFFGFFAKETEIAFRKALTGSESSKTIVKV